jgi:hypothetical protein
MGLSGATATPFILTAAGLIQPGLARRIQRYGLTSGKRYQRHFPALHNQTHALQHCREPRRLTPITILVHVDFITHLHRLGLGLGFLRAEMESVVRLVCMERRQDAQRFQAQVSNNAAYQLFSVRLQFENNQ